MGDTDVSLELEPLPDSLGLNYGEWHCGDNVYTD